VESLRVRRVDLDDTVGSASDVDAIALLRDGASLAADVEGWGGREAKDAPFDDGAGGCRHRGRGGGRERGLLGPGAPGRHEWDCDQDGEREMGLPHGGAPLCKVRT
jgi:hypothetical protein